MAAGAGPVTAKSLSAESTSSTFKFTPTDQLADVELDQFDALATAAQNQIQHRVGDFQVDKLIGFLYYLLNSFFSFRLLES